MNTLSLKSCTVALVSAVIAVVALLSVSPASARARGSAAGPELASCSWDRPGADPYMGDVVAAVDGYTDIPVEVRDRLKARMVRRGYDDIVTIRRDSITGKGRYGSTIRDMHFGTRQLCHTVSRTAWPAATQERGLVYCDSGQCILVPTVCRNVSRIARAEVDDERAIGEPLLPLVAAVAPEQPAAVVPFGGATAVPSDQTFAIASGVPDVEGLGGFGGYGGVPIAGSSGGGGSGGGGSNGGGSSGGDTPPGGGSPTQPTAPVSPVPEPETWGLMLAGLALVGAVRRRGN